MSKHTTITITLDIDPQDLASIVDDTGVSVLLAAMGAVSVDILGRDLASTGDGIRGSFGGRRGPLQPSSSTADIVITWTLRGDS